MKFSTQVKPVSYIKSDAAEIMKDISSPLLSSPRRVGVREFRGNLTSFLQQVQDGQRFVLTSHHKVVASSDVGVRKPGAMRGRIKIADNFDSLPADVLKAMEDGA